MSKLLDNLHIPSIWKFNKSQSYIANPRTLRLCYLFVTICALLTFIGTIIYYFVFQREITTTIDFSSDLGDDWECASLGTYSGDFSLLSRSNPPSWNLTRSVESGFVELFDEQTTYISINDGSKSYSFQPLQPIGYRNEYIGTQTWETRSSYAILAGNARTVEDCVTEYTNYACSNVNTSNLWTNVKLYKFTLESIDFTGTWSGDGSSDLSEHFLYSSNIVLYDDSSSSSYDFDDAIFYTNREDALSRAFSNNSAYIYTMNEDANMDLCSVVQSGIDNDVFTWGGTIHWDSSNSCSYPSRCSSLSYIGSIQVTYDISCELISNDYCGINATDAFTVTNTNKFESGMTMIHNKDANNGNWWGFTTQIMMGSELGDTCQQRWQAICEEHFDIEGLCERMFVSPFKCTKEDRKELWTILSLSFSSSQLVLALLSVVIGWLFRRCGKPVTEEKSNKQQENSDKIGMETEIETASINNNKDSESSIHNDATNKQASTPL